MSQHFNKPGKRRVASADSPENQDPRGDESVEDVKPKLKKSKKAKAEQEEDADMAEQQYENGIIHKIVLENFMNHAHLQLDLSPHINFIVGKNGSGKSAIVASLIAGFGAKAASTGRNTRTEKALIKHGCEYALIKIHVANGGEDAFLHDEFGDTIIVEHRIERQGAGTFKLKSGDGRHERKTNRKEIESLCTHMDIQASNPCVLLTQESAKKFLHNGSENSRYSFFLEAAGLQSVKDDLAETHQNLELEKERLARALEEQPEREKKAEKAQAELDGAKTLARISAEHKELEKVYGWACVISYEEKIAQHKEQAKAAKVAAEAEQARMSEHDSKLKEAEERAKAAQAEVDGLLEQMKMLGKKGQAAKEKASAQRRAVDAAKADVARIQEEVDDTLKERELVEARLAKAEEVAGKKRSQQQARLEQQKKAEEKQLAAAQQKREELVAKMEEAVAAARAAKQAKDEAEAEAGELEDKYRQMREEAQAAKGKTQSAIDRLHPDMASLLRLIEQKKHLFQAPPIGPLGKFVTIKKGCEDLSQAIEVAAGGVRNLSTFVVHSAKDEETLRQLARELPSQRNSRLPPLSQSLGVQRRSHEGRYEDIGPRPPLPQKYKTVLEAVNIDNDMAFNYFNDTRSINQVVLFPTVDEGVAELDKLRKDVTAKGVAIDKFSTIFRRRSGLSGVEYNPQAPKGVLVGDAAKAAQQREQELATMDRFVRNERDQAKRAAAEAKAASERELVARKELKACDATEKQAKSNLQRLAAKEEEDSVSEELRVMRSDIDEKTRSVEKLTQEGVAAEERLAAAQAAQSQEKGGAQEHHKAFQDLKALSKEKEKEVDEAVGDRTRLTNAHRKMRKAVDAQYEKVRQAKEAEADAARSLKVMMPEVIKRYGEERLVDEQGRGEEELRKAFEALGSKKKRQEQKHGGRSLAELEAWARKMIAECRHSKVQLENCTEQNEGRAAAFQERYKYWKKDCKKRGRQASLDFNMRLSKRQHAGTLEVDHANESLALLVERNSQDANSSSTKDARNLSGGERSFTTLAFELAMWEFSQSPIRVLDEFDVYMDDTYRKEAVKTLLELCGEQPRRQFLFITPQDMHPFLKGVKPCPNIVRMADPERSGSGGAGPSGSGGE